MYDCIYAYLYGKFKLAAGDDAGDVAWCIVDGNPHTLPLSSELSTYKTVEATFKTVKAVYKTVKARTQYT